MWVQALEANNKWGQTTGEQLQENKWGQTTNSFDSPQVGY